MAAQPLPSQFWQRGDQVGSPPGMNFVLGEGQFPRALVGDLKRVAPFARPANQYVVGFLVDVDNRGHAALFPHLRIMARASLLYQSKAVLGMPNLSAASWALQPSK